MPGLFIERNAQEITFVQQDFIDIVTKFNHYSHCDNFDLPAELKGKNIIIRTMQFTMPYVYVCGTFVDLVKTFKKVFLK